MYCRTCGNKMNDNAEICVKCGCRPLIGREFCQVCGAPTTERQELCIKCGSMLKQSTGKSSNIFEGISFGNSSEKDILVSSRFLDLPPYYQQEFQKIYDSNENYKGKFNIWAFLLGSIWALVKGCWLSAIICFVISIATGGIGGVVYWFVFGFRGTYMYYSTYVKKQQCLF